MFWKITLIAIGALVAAQGAFVQVWGNANWITVTFISSAFLQQQGPVSIRSSSLVSDLLNLQRSASNMSALRKILIERPLHSIALWIWTFQTSELNSMERWTVSCAELMSG